LSNISFYKDLFFLRAAHKSMRRTLGALGPVLITTNKSTIGLLQFFSQSLEHTWQQICNEKMITHDPILPLCGLSCEISPNVRF